MCIEVQLFILFAINIELFYFSKLKKNSDISIIYRPWADLLFKSASATKNPYQ